MNGYSGNAVYYLVLSIIGLVSVLTLYAYGDEDKNILSSSCSAINESNGIDFNWGALKSNSELEVCLLKLANFLGSVGEMEKWLKQQGFRQVRPRSSIPGRVLLEGQWDAELSEKPMPFIPDFSLWERFVTKDKIYDVSITYIDGIPTNSRASHRIK